MQTECYKCITDLENNCTLKYLFISLSVLTSEKESFYNLKLTYGSSICFHYSRHTNCYKRIFCRYLSRLIPFYRYIPSSACKDRRAAKLGKNTQLIEIID